MNHIERILSEFPFVVIDGGLATELEAMGYDLRGRLWSAKVLAENPDAVMEIHRSYLEAGADCIISSSYQATIPGFTASGYSRSGAVDLIKRSVRIARDAVEQFASGMTEGERPLPFVAASAGCYGAFLSDGSEYRGDYRLSLKGYKDFHRERLEILVDAGADFIAFETFPNIDEALAVSELMDDFPGIFYWIVFTAYDEKHISHGEPFSDCVKELSGRKSLAGTGINCSRPELVSPLLREVDSSAGIPLVVYPNSGERFDTGCTCWKDESSRVDFLLLSEEWYSLGARAIGGCCRTGPDDIRKISAFRKRLIESAGGG